MILEQVEAGNFMKSRKVDHEGLLNYSKKITTEIDFPIFGIDVGFNGKEYYLLEFQTIHSGPFTLQNSKFWHEFHNGNWIRYEGLSDLEEEFSAVINDYIEMKYQKT